MKLSLQIKSVQIKSVRNLFIALMITVISSSSFSAAAQEKPKIGTPQPNLAKQYQVLAETGKPIYLTTDAAFEQTAWYFSDALEAIEKEQLAKNLENGLTDAFERTAAALEAEKTDAARTVLSANLAYLLTAMRLLLPESDARLKTVNSRVVSLLISPELRSVADETKLVLAAKELKKSPVLGYVEDYTQYTPRGRYAGSAEQTQYFRAVVWLGRMGFYTEPNRAAGIDEAKADALTAQGLTLLAVLPEKNAFTEFNSTITALVGASDDLTIAESNALAQKAVGKQLSALTPAEAAANSAKVREIIKKEARKPKILSTVAAEGTETPSAIRIIGQRFTPDAYVFQNLTFAQIQDFNGKGKEPFTMSVTAQGRKVRGVPRVFDVMSALGSAAADAEIKTGGDDLYNNFNAQSEKIRSEMHALLGVNNFTNLYLTAIKENSISQSGVKTSDELQKRIRLNSGIGGYVLLRRELAAYAKQSYTNVARGLGKETEPRRSAPPIFVQPAPKVFDALKKAVEAIAAASAAKSLAERGQRLAQSLQTLSAAANGEQLEAAKSAEIWKIIDDWATSSKQSAVIADVHTDLNSKQVLEIAVGEPQIIEVSVGSQKAAAAVFTAYEFRQPFDQRLTDDAWRKMLKDVNHKAKFRLFVLQ